MPSSITLGLLLLFIYLYLPATFYRWWFRRQVPLRGYPLQFDEEFIYIYGPAFLNVIVSAFVFYFLGYRFSEPLFLAAIGNAQGLDDSAIAALLTCATASVMSVFLPCITSGISGHVVGIRRRNAIILKDDGILELGRSAGPYDNWYRLFLVAGSGSRASVNIDVWTKNKTLYSGKLVDYQLSKDGELSGLTLTDVSRYTTDPLEKLPKVTSPWSAAEKGTVKLKRIPGKLVHFFASDISNFNLHWFKGTVDGQTIVATDVRTGAQSEEDAKREILDFLNEIKSQSGKLSQT